MFEKVLEFKDLRGKGFPTNHKTVINITFTFVIAIKTNINLA